jgi:hypothetical protein
VTIHAESLKDKVKKGYLIGEFNPILTETQGALFFFLPPQIAGL